MSGSRIAARRGLIIGSLIFGLCQSAVLRADVDVWYELISNTGPGAGVVAVTQGAAGQRLLITTDSVAGNYDLTIRCFAGVPVSESLYGYAIDLVAPSAANVQVTSMTHLGPFPIDDPFTLAAGPGKILDNAAQIDLGTTYDGVLTLFECTIRVTQPPTTPVEIFSGIGISAWGSVAANFNVLYADAIGIDGGDVGAVSSTPSIVISALGAPPPVDCNNNAVPDSQEIAANPALDCNSNGTLDSCEIAANLALDCNNNGKLDTCEIAANAVLDCNSNGKLDSCEINAGTLPDCNKNGVPDACDISNGTSKDANANAVPDECDPPPTTPDATTQSDDSSTTGSSSSNGKVVDRTDLRKRLAFWFGVPMEGVDPLWLLPAKTIGFLGINAGAVWAAVDLQSLPLRALIFELTYSLLDALLP